MFLVTLQLTGSNQGVNNVYVHDTLPANLLYQNQMIVSGNSNYSGDITSGLNLNNLSSGQTITISYQTQIAGAQNFSYGTTTLTNNVSVTSSSISGNQNASASVIVNRAQVLGASSVSTGLTNNFWADSFFLPLLIALAGLWMAKSGMFLGVEKWFVNKNKNLKANKAERELNRRILSIQRLENN